jgi:signal transduction histidine kinase
MSADTPKVLVIDDQEVNLKLMRTYLRGEPYEVTTSTDARASLDLIDQDPPDLILLDLMMPVLDGFEMLELLKDIAPQVPVIVITGVADRDARLRGLAAGARDFLTKPVDRSELLIRVRNLVDLKRAGDALARAVAQLESANRDLDAFAGGLAHDLQQPITSISAFAQIIQRASGHQLTPENAAHLTRILTAAGSADRMIRGLLEFARLGQKKIEARAVDLNEVLQEARNALAAKVEGRTVRWQASPLPTVHGDPALLLLAFVNLLSNAIKYTGKVPEAEIAITAEADASGYAVRVRDNGVGFDMAHAGHLFDPFERLHSASEFEGTGMGLANVRRIMERHGGTVSAQSAPGQGATFTLVFRT